MNKIIAALLLCTAHVAPASAIAREVTIDAKLVNYSGNAAYLSVYLTKPDGSYDSTLWVSGTKQRYLGELSGWVSAMRGAGVSTLNLDGITGASVGGGQTLTVKADLADALIDAGYTDPCRHRGGARWPYSDDAVAPLSSTTEPVDGTGYVSKLGGACRSLPDAPPPLHCRPVRRGDRYLHGGHRVSPVASLRLRRWLRAPGPVPQTPPNLPQRRPRNCPVSSASPNRRRAPWWHIMCRTASTRR